MQTEAEAVLELRQIKAELAAVQDAMAPYRMRRRAVRDRIAAACVQTNEADQIVTSWRPPSVAEVAELDEVNAWAADGLNPLIVRERCLKEAVRVAEINLKQTKSVTRKKRGTDAENDHPKASASIRVALQGSADADAFPHTAFANADGMRKTPHYPPVGDAGRQGDLFDGS